ncbi:serine/threonine-protein kinase [Streptosporangium lutulentum]|uniref:Serine/threonine protein kinase n=1 Tax=Streptosporangium lutulentum TaxID=1461250 RepID=A0ABT9QTM4_9ACTN|nr:serine/threonine-protein kinase [Streptosporangium lutulentum]MDP9849364.1 serine/threonine protein kinase [Streptosporangium lutulentum]
MKQDDRLGPYQLLRRLGEGGMGVVHLAVDPQGRQVAVKVLRSEVAGDDVARRRLSREVETMRRVRSEYIAEVLDADVTGHRPYIVTRYIAGPPLDEVVKRDGPMELPALLKIAHGVASALAAVHSVGVIHRDLKPGNVLILDGQPVLIDFGIAQAVDATRLTQTGMFIGTPGYLAPEIIEGHEAGPEVDVHAWAGTLVFAATGQPPFGKGTLEMIFYNITAGKANVDAVPRALQPVLRAALQRDPAKRPKAAELVAQVARLLPGTGRVKMPDEISTLPHLDDSSPDARGASGRPEGQGNRAGSRAPGVPGLPADAGDVPTPVASRPGVPSSTPWPPAPVAQPREYVSLLGEEDSDPAATRRVTPEELRQLAAAQQEAYDQPTGVLSPEDIPTRGPAIHNQLKPDVAGRQGATTPVPDGDIPTQRVRPQDLQEYIRNHPPQPGYPAQPNHPSPTPPPQPYPQRQGSFEQTPQVRQPPQSPPPPYPYPHPKPPQQQPQPQPQPSAPSFHPGQRPGHALQRSKAYGVASALLLVVMAVAAVMAPAIVAVVMIPAAILLRAADIAQPRLNAQRPVGAAAADVFRVIGQPAALLKSVGVTVALVPYALILGLPVTLLLAVLVRSMPVPNALSWGTAVALWTICAGPGVEGPSRQMRRTLASLLPSRSAAMLVAAVLGAVAAIMVFLAVGTVKKDAGPAVWTPVDVGTVVDELRQLREKAA